MKPFIYSLFLLLFISCQKEDEQVNKNNEEPSLIIKFIFDSNQMRLDGQGKIAIVPENHAAQSPYFKEISAHYIELVPNKLTQVKEGAIIFQGNETNIDGENAVDFSKAIIGKPNEVYHKIPLKNIPTGTYEYLRVSITFQKYLVKYIYENLALEGTLSSFIGFNNYISQHQIDQKSITLNTTKKQGFWAFETVGQVSQGQSLEGATTVPNPIGDSSPIPEGSCLVTGIFEEKFTITENETKDITLTISLSNNESFEWKEVTKDGKYEPTIGEDVVDMGIRGLIPIIEK